MASEGYVPVEQEDLSAEGILKELKFSPLELLEIINCGDVKALREKLGYKGPLPKIGEEFKAIKIGHHNRSLESVIQTTSEPLGAYWLLVSLVSLGIAALPLTWIAFVFTGIFGGHNYWKQRKKLKVAKQEHLEFFQFAELQTTAFKFAIAGMKEEIKRLSPPEEYKNLVITHLSASAIPDAKLELVSYKKSMLASLGMAGLIWAAYYLGTAWILDAVGVAFVAAVMLSPPSVAIAAGVALLIGLYFGVKHYKATQSANLLESYKHKCTEDMTRKRDQAAQWKMWYNTNRLGFFSQPSPTATTAQPSSSPSSTASSDADNDDLIAPPSLRRVSS